jgi:hypothetical protein
MSFLISGDGHKTDTEPKIKYRYQSYTGAEKNYMHREERETQRKRKPPFWTPGMYNIIAVGVP